MAYLGNNNLPFDPTRTVAAPRDADRFSGNGSTTAFTLTRSVNKATDVEVFVENVQQEPITAYDVAGTALTFTGAPPSGTNNVYVVYRNFDSGAQVYVPDGSITYSKLANNIRIFTTDNLTPNGNNSVFTLSEPPADANTVFVTVDGVMQRAPVHYTTSGSTITFTSAPPVGSNVHVRHLGFRTSVAVTAIPVGTYIPQPNIAAPTISTPTVNGLSTFNDNIGVKTTPTSGWSSSFPVVEFPNGSFVGQISGSAFLGTNLYYDGSNWKYKTTNRASLIGVGVDGTFTYYNAPSDTAGNNVSLTAQSYIDVNGLSYFNSGYGSAGKAYGCRAWVNFNGTGTVAIRGSGNVSSITDNGAGDYTVNFTSAMPDANYSVGGILYHMSGTTYGNAINLETTSSLTTTGVRVSTWIEGTGANYQDSSTVCVQVFR
jgi:hypothetical protein